MMGFLGMAVGILGNVIRMFLGPLFAVGWLLLSIDKELYY